MWLWAFATATSWVAVAASIDRPSITSTTMSPCKHRLRRPSPGFPRRRCGLARRSAIRTRCGRTLLGVSDAPIGIFDSGFGGLTVARAVLDQLPHEPLLYLGDTARQPYGSKAIGEVRE